MGISVSQVVNLSYISPKFREDTYIFFSSSPKRLKK